MTSRSRVRTAAFGTWLLIAAACGSPASSVDPGGGSRASTPAASGSKGPEASGSTGPAPSLPPPGEVLEPAAAAAAVLGAPDDPARIAAVLAILDGVNFGVYTPDGDPIVVGAERSEGDVWAYDFEVAGLAAAVRDGDEVALTSIADDLVELANADGGAAFTPAEVVQAVHLGAAAVVADPGTAGAYALAVAVELGRQGARGVDLAAPPTDDPVLLDGLAAFLVTLDLVLPYVGDRAPTGLVHDGRVASIGDARLAAGPCPQRIAGSGGWIAGISAGSVGGLGGISNASFDRYLQGRLVGGTVGVRLEGAAEWHHGHQDAHGQSDGSDRLYELTLAVRVPGPTGDVACGSLSGASLPPLGAIVGADVRWTHRGLERHGTIDADPRTSDRGNAFLVVTPNVEQYPSEIGPEQRVTIPIEAQVNVLQALGGDLYQRLAGVPALQSRTVHTQVSWHRTYVVELDVESQLVATRGTTYMGELGKTTATGTFPVVEYFTVTQVPKVGPPHPLSVVSLTTTTTPARTKGDCFTEWIEEKPGAPRIIDWTIGNLIVYPEADIRLRMDAGPYSEDMPDSYDGLLCPPAGRVRLGPSPGNVWETLIFLAYPRGVLLTGTGPGGWDILATSDTWARGGKIAEWSSQETCQGYCRGTLKVTIRVRPLPGP